MVTWYRLPIPVSAPAFVLAAALAVLAREPLLDEGGNRESKMTFTGGAGMVLPPIGRVRPFVEARYVRVMGALPDRLIPLALGIAF